MDPVPAAARPPSRIDLVDVLRGVAIAAMVVYHFSWDLSFYRFVDWPVETGTGWRWFAHLIAGSFIVLVGASDQERGWIATHEPAIKRLARVEAISEAEAPPPQSAQVILGDVAVCLPLSGVVDLDAERARLQKELDRLAGEIKKIDAKLSNPSFVERAPEEVVEEQRDRREEAESRRAKVQEALGRL